MFLVMDSINIEGDYFFGYGFPLQIMEGILKNRSRPIPPQKKHCFVVFLRKWKAFCAPKTAETSECNEQEGQQAELRKIHEVCTPCVHILYVDFNSFIFTFENPPGVHPPVRGKMMGRIACAREHSIG